MISFIKKYRYIFLLIAIEIALFFTNFRPRTYLVGWDNVYPELNFTVNLQRSLFTIWQEYRGLGAIDGMAHSALIPHTFLILFLSFFLQKNLLRYTATFILHLIGGIGMYILLKSRLPKDQKDHNEFASFLGALFYELNLITVQMFFTPLEVFSYHFAFLPILIHLVLSYFHERKKKTLFLFALLSLVSTPQAHVPSVFIVYFLAVFTIFLFEFLFHKKSSLKPIIILLTVIIGTNAFWGFPYIYSALYSSKTIVNSKINQMSTDNVILRNQAFGNFTSVALLRGFTLDYVDYQPTGQNDFMMKPWRDHIAQFPIVVLSIFAFILSLTGLIHALLYRQKYLYPFIAIGGFAFLMLGNDIPVLSLFSKGLGELIPLFYNIYRFTFTKFSIIYVFCYTIFLSYALHLLLRRVKGALQFQSIGLLSGALILIYSLPSFQGNFLYTNIKNVLPSSYLKLIEFFDKQDWSSRIATFPQPSFWGWTYYLWNSRGSGFLWYGLPEATLDGAFYPWSRQNENYYWEVSQAVYSSSLPRLENVLKKYEVKWLVVDESIISPFSPRALYSEKLEELLTHSTLITPAATIDQIKVYKVNSENSHYVTVKNNLPVVGPDYSWNNFDKAYEDLGNYISQSATDPKLSTNNQTYYPFRSLFSGRKQEELEFKVEDKGDYFSLKSLIPVNLAGGNLLVPPLMSNEVLEVDQNNLENPAVRYPEIYLDDELILYSKGLTTFEPISLPYIKKGYLEIRVPKIKGLYSYDSKLTDILSDSPPTNCDEMKKGSFSTEKMEEQGFSLIRFNSFNSDNCIEINLPSLIQKNGYLISIENRNIEGTSILLGFNNTLSNRTDLQTYLPTAKEINTSFFVFPPMEEFGLGYSLSIDNASIGRVKSVNDLGRIMINPIPYRFLTSLKVIGKDSTNQPPETNNSQLISVDHPNPSYYQVTFNSEQITNNKNTTLILSQSFDNGWKSYQIECTIENVQCAIKKLMPFIFGKEIKDHILVNNWENGWKLDNLIMKPYVADAPRGKQLNHETIVIYYLPQLLEFIGFGMLPFPFIGLLFVQKKKRHPPVYNNL